MRGFAVGLFLSVGAWLQPADCIGTSLPPLAIVLGAGGAEAEALGSGPEALGEVGVSLWLAAAAVEVDAAAVAAGVLALAAALGVAAGGTWVCEGGALGVTTALVATAALEAAAPALGALAAVVADALAPGRGLPESLSALQPRAASSAKAYVKEFGRRALRGDNVISIIRIQCSFWVQ